jgi:hypothetical protein
MFTVTGEPDIVLALIDQGKATARIRLTECEPLVCYGTLESAVAGHKKGAAFEMGTSSVTEMQKQGADLPIEPFVHELPVAWPKGTRPKTTGDALLDALRRGQ